MRVLTSTSPPAHPRTHAQTGTTNSLTISRISTPLGSNSVDRLSNILQDGFEQMGIQIHKTTTATFDQLIERLDELSGVIAMAAPISEGGEHVGVRRGEERREDEKM